MKKMKKLTATIAAIAATTLALTGIALTGVTLTGAASASAATLETPVSLGTVADSSGSSYESVALGDLIYFTIEFDDTAEVWYTDGDSIARIATFERTDDLVVFDGDVYLSARQDEANDGLWRVTPAGADLVSTHNGTGDAQPAVEELHAVGSALFYYTWGGEDADDTILWSWDGTSASNLGQFEYISDLGTVGDSVVFIGDDGDGNGLWWGTATDGLEVDDSMDSVEDLIEFGNTAVMFAYDGSNFGLWTWSPADGSDLVVELDYGNDFFTSGDRVIVSGENDAHSGLWSWDGTTLTPISPEFTSAITGLEVLGGSYYFYGEDATNSGFWELDGMTVSFVKEIPGPGDVTPFGDALLFTTTCCDPEPLYSWDGTDDDPTLVSDDWNLIERTRVADSYALVLVRTVTSDLQAWILRADPLASLEVTPSTTNIVAGSSVTFTVNGFDSGHVALGDMTAEANFVSDPPATTSSGDTLTFETVGTYEVTASIGSISVTAEVVVGPAALSSIEVSTTDSGLIVGDTADFTVEGFDEFGNSVGDVTADGAFSTVPTSTAVAGSAITFNATGSFDVTAEVDGHQGTLTLQVDTGTIESIELEFSATTVAVGGQLTFVVNGQNANGVVIDDLTAGANVESDHPDIIVGNTITFPHASPHEITATARQLQDVVVIQVTPAALASTGDESLWFGALAALLLLAGLGTALVRKRVRVRRQG